MSSGCGPALSLRLYSYCRQYRIKYPASFRIWSSSLKASDQVGNETTPAAWVVLDRLVNREGFLVLE